MRAAKWRFSIMGLLEDARNIQRKDPAARTVLEVILLYPGFHILVYHRIAHWLFEHKHFFLARWVSQRGRHKTGIEIHPGAKIGKCLFIDHGMGIVFGETAEIGDNCTIYHGVTLGGTGKDTGKRHPTLGNNVLIGAGTKVLGPVYIGDNARIGAGSVVLKNLPANCTAVGVPAEVVRINNKAINPADDLDQQDLPDLMAQRLIDLDRRIGQLEKAAQGDIPPRPSRWPPGSAGGKLPTAHSKDPGTFSGPDAQTVPGSCFLLWFRPLPALPLQRAGSGSRGFFRVGHIIDHQSESLTLDLPEGDAHLHITCQNSPRVAKVSERTAVIIVVSRIDDFVGTAAQIEIPTRTVVALTGGNQKQCSYWLGSSLKPTTSWFLPVAVFRMFLTWSFVSL